jgi:hypothetical protein
MELVYHVYSILPLCELLDGRCFLSCYVDFLKIGLGFNYFVVSVLTVAFKSALEFIDSGLISRTCSS